MDKSHIFKQKPRSPTYLHKQIDPTIKAQFFLPSPLNFASLAAMNSFTYNLSEDEQVRLQNLVATRGYETHEKTHAHFTIKPEGCNVTLYHSGKCLIQGKGSEDWIRFELEPQVLLRAELDYQDELHPEYWTAHIGIDESGKGDFFGPLVIAACYVDENTKTTFAELDIKDSKRISSDKKAIALAEKIKKACAGQFHVITLTPPKYNELYDSFGNLNRLLAWGHAAALESLLEKVPDCPRALADQFGPKHEIEKRLKARGQQIELEQRTKAESDPAVAAASILARAEFLNQLKQQSTQLDIEIPKGASAKVKETAREILEQHSENILAQHCKMHFKTYREVLS